MTPSPWSVVLAVVALSSCGQFAQAAVLAQYNFPASPNTFLSSDSDPNSTASDFFFSGMGTLGTDHGRSSATVAPNLNTIYTRGNGLTTTEAGAISGNDYYSFTLTPSAGFAASLTTLTFLTDSTHGGGAVDYSTTILVRSSRDNYGSNIATFVDGPSASTTSFNARSVTLSDTAFQNLSSPVTFRIYLYQTGPTAAVSDAVFRSDTYVLNGTLNAIPEPRALPMVGIGFLVLVLGNRVRHRIS